MTMKEKSMNPKDYGSQVLIRGENTIKKEKQNELRREIQREVIYENTISK